MAEMDETKYREISGAYRRSKSTTRQAPSPLNDIEVGSSVMVGDELTLPSV